MRAELTEYINRAAVKKALEIPPEAAVELTFLAQGEYNRNYWFVHPVTGRKLILRLNYGSQMHLEDQISYEYRTLRMIHISGRTPEALYVDSRGDGNGHGILVEEFLPGHALDYETDLDKAADCLADIHSVPAAQAAHLLRPDAPLQAILEECRQMFRVYREFPGRDEKKCREIDRLLQKGALAAARYAGGSYPLRCINTELNNTNFLVDDEQGIARLVDWEKPILGDPAQDLGHFLAPTTTFWKTDTILTDGQVDAFLERYVRAVRGRLPTDGLGERVRAFIPITCLRGLTWCAMAWVQYQRPDGLQNESTRKKLDEYLDWPFLELVGQRF